MIRLFGDRIDSRRRREAERARGVLSECLTTPLPDRATAAGELPILAVDFETTGLDPGQDKLLSVGFVAINGTEIDLGTAAGFVINANAEVGQSATVHGLTDDQLAAGCPLEEAVAATVSALSGRIMLAHFADIEEIPRRRLPKPLRCRPATREHRHDDAPAEDPR